MPTLNSPESGDDQSAEYIIPGGITWDGATQYANDLINGLDTDTENWAYISPRLVEVVGAYVSDPDEFVNELFLLGVKESSERMEAMGPMPKIHRETIDPARSGIAKPPRPTIRIYDQDTPPTPYKEMLLMAGAVVGGLVLYKFGVQPIVENPEGFASIRRMFSGH